MRDNARLDLLVTGFGPFPRVKINPAGRLAEKVAGDGRWARLGWRVCAEVLHVGYASVAERLQQIAQAPPRALLMFGVAARSKAVRIELRARNRVSRQARDQSRALPGDNRLQPGAASFRQGRAAFRPALLAMRAAGVPTRLSRDAGAYVCNAAYWQALRHLPRETRVLFVHIPMPMKPGTRKRDSRPDFAAMLTGARGLALGFARAPRLTRGAPPI